MITKEQLLSLFSYTLSQTLQDHDINFIQTYHSYHMPKSLVFSCAKILFLVSLPFVAVKYQSLKFLANCRRII